MARGSPNRVRAFVCHLCGKTLATRFTLNRHVKEHNDIFLTCRFPGCTQQSKQSYNLEVHYITKHLHAKEFVCRQCFNSYDFESQLKEHKRRSKHKDPKPKDVAVVPSAIEDQWTPEPDNLVIDPNLYNEYVPGYVHPEYDTPVAGPPLPYMEASYTNVPAFIDTVGMTLPYGENAHIPHSAPFLDYNVFLPHWAGYMFDGA